MKSIKILIVAVFATFVSANAVAQNSKTVVENAIASEDHTILVAAIKAAELVETLSGQGPFTVFAPTNEAFAKIPKGAVETLLKPKNKAKLQAILTYHVVAGNLDSSLIVAAIKTGNGTAILTTFSSAKLVASLEGKDVVLTDENGNKSRITTVDVFSSNGVIHVIDNVVLPK